MSDANGTPRRGGVKARRRSTGQLYETKTRRGISYGVRFRTQGGERIYESLGKSWEGMTRADAQRAADDLLARVRLGQYKSRAERQREQEERERAREEVPFFAHFADEWLERRRTLGGRRGRGLSVSGQRDLAWRIAHLSAWFGGMRLNEITEEEVEAYAAAKRAAPLREGGLGATSVNKTLSTMEAILRTAVRYRRINRDPVDGYRVPGSGYVAAHMDTAASMSALLDAAEARDRRGRLRHGHGRALLATLLFAGLRIGEALALTWRDIDLANGRLRVRDGKTENARRTVYLLPPLREELSELKARRDPERSALVFGTARGRADSASNVRRRILKPAIEDANVILDGRDEELIPANLTLHGLRHTHISVMLVIGEEPGYVADQVGHADAGFTYSRYRKRIARRDGEPERLRALFCGTADTIGAVASVPLAA